MPVAIAIMPILLEISAPALGIRRALPVAGSPRGDGSKLALRVPKDRLIVLTRRRTLHASLWRMDDIRGLARFPTKSANHGIERRGKQEAEPGDAQHARENGGA
jgi:hypothetical protein